MIVSIDIPDEQHLLIKTPNPERFYQILPKVIVDNDFAVDELFSPDDNLQAVFKYLVKK